MAFDGRSLVTGTRGLSHSKLIEVEIKRVAVLVQEDVKFA